MIRLAALLFLVAAGSASAQSVLIPMDDGQADHLKAYGAVYWALAQGIEVDWLLNVRGGAFVAPADRLLADELRVRGVTFESANGAALVAEAVTATGAAGPGGMGAVMKAVGPKVAGRAEGGRVAAAVRAALSG